MRTKKLLIVVGVIIFAGLIFIGIFRDEVKEVIYNATVLCLSCIGIG